MGNVCGGPPESSRGKPGVAVPDKVGSKEALESKRTVKFDTETIDHNQDEARFKANQEKQEQLKRKQTYGDDKSNMFLNRTDT